MRGTLPRGSSRAHLFKAQVQRVGSRHRQHERGSWTSWRGRGGHPTDGGGPVPVATVRVQWMAGSAAPPCLAAIRHSPCSPGLDCTPGAAPGDVRQALLGQVAGAPGSERRGTWCSWRERAPLANPCLAWPAAETAAAELVGAGGAPPPRWRGHGTAAKHHPTAASGSFALHKPCSTN